MPAQLGLFIVHTKISDSKTRLLFYVLFDGCTGSTRMTVADYMFLIDVFSYYVFGPYRVDHHHTPK